MTSKRKLYREDEKLFFLHSYYQSGMSKQIIFTGCLPYNVKAVTPECNGFYIMK